MSAGSQNLLALVVAMLVFAILAFSLAIITMRGSPVALSRVRLKERKQDQEAQIWMNEERNPKRESRIEIGKIIRRPNIL